LRLIATISRTAAFAASLFFGRYSFITPTERSGSIFSAQFRFRLWPTARRCIAILLHDGIFVTILPF
jgi:hypothetical protein